MFMLRRGKHMHGESGPGTPRRFPVSSGLISASGGTGPILGAANRPVERKWPMQVDVSGQQFVFPDICACCCGHANSTLSVAASKSTGKKVVHTRTNTWDFPYCGACLGHVRAAEAAVSLAWVLV